MTLMCTSASDQAGDVAGRHTGARAVGGSGVRGDVAARGGLRGADVGARKLSSPSERWLARIS